MIFGTLGDVAFSMTAIDQVEHIVTFNNFQWGGSSSWETHQRHLTHSLTEYTGIAPDTLSLDIQLVQQMMRRDLQWYIGKIFTYEREGTPVPLVIGTKAYGKYRWTVLSHSVKAEHFNIAGAITACTLTVNLQEYLRE